ncbi:hypothetical protein NEOLI_000783 [Neolecta irregularis DAH-3]|uniref:Phosphatidate phosphatase APP1 catalytic domain-containing protein n=1 Tax=Neolecta irregularis (strain DAH-3) TaxID=1198029 RepID=A0A1U7LWL4_NEOID|nr:hypothetical protein NEOLI_000783 [Neolecta irregularis DAH-3]|eukprot:OLL27070.1 hypothetical protein NEOLI_000783 [Neolecta irregularis DAH-3]
MKIPSFIIEMPPPAAFPPAPPSPLSHIFRRSFSALQPPSLSLGTPRRSFSDDSDSDCHSVSDPQELVLFPSYAYSAPHSPAELHVHVHGWIYASPRATDFTRKHRLLMGLARQIAGLPSLSPTDDSFFSANDLGSPKGKSVPALSESAPFSPRPRNSLVFRRQPTLPRYERYFPNTSLDVLHSNLTERILPVISQPVVSRQVLIQLIGHPSGHILKEETIETDDRGHFKSTLVLASPAVEKITILARSSSDQQNLLVQESSCSVVADRGISIITDVDDTLKKSNVTAGKRELFRNVFLRDHAEVQIQGVKEWFNDLASKGIHFHYVSSSPWQVWPTMREFFREGELPKGSVHLKLYTGVLSGLWQPAMEKKRANLESIFNDFPYRHFILNGDSGEKDLEIYTDMAVKFPKQVLAIMIRDVSTSTPQESTYLRPEPSDSNLSTTSEDSIFSDYSSRENQVPLSPTDQSPSDPPSGSSLSRTDSAIYKSFPTPPRKIENFQRRLSRYRQLLKPLNVDIHMWETGVDAQHICNKIIESNHSITMDTIKSLE